MSYVGINDFVRWYIYHLSLRNCGYARRNCGYCLGCGVDAGCPNCGGVKHCIGPGPIGPTEIQKLRACSSRSNRPVVRTTG